jgi:CheY-like chemotaxis protein
MDKRVIYVVEDDPFQAEWIVELLQQKFGDQVEVKQITTQYGFESNFETIAADQPAGIILDVMLQWKDTDVAKDPKSLDSYRRAGLDCRNMLAKDARTRRVPVMLYSVLDRATVRDLAPGTEFLRKDSNDRELVAWVRGVLTAASTPQV